MKLSPPVKKAGIVLAVGLVVSSLIVFVVFSLLNLQQSGSMAERFVRSTEAAIQNAAQKHKLLTTNPELVNQEKDVIEPLVTVRKKLESIYLGADLEARKFVPSSESVKVLLKLCIVDIENATEAVKAKTAPDFEAANKAFGEFGSTLIKRYNTRLQIIKYVGWLSVAVVFGIAIGLAVYEYRATRKEQTDFVATQSLLDEESKRVEKLSGFIEAISSGNYSIDLEGGDHDELNAKLAAMRDKLMKNAEDDQQRNWASAGLAQAGEILRAHSSSQLLYDNIIKFVVKYTKSNQGGLFILSEEEREQSLDLVACYAYERKKFLTRKVDVGQGLIGQCYLEQEKIHLTRIPEDYVNITSGLGGTNPNSLLLMPLKANDTVYGVLELATFSAYKEFEMEWIERLAESIASTVASVRTNESTRLLLERTQQQAEEMKSQEEEMRQNMEELSATQEEMARKEREYIARIGELEGQLAVEVR